MRSCLTVCALLFLGAALWAEPAPRGWITSYEAARQEAAKTGKPIFLIFRCDP